MAPLPAPVRDGVTRVLVERGDGPIVSVTPVSGGCINHGVRVGDAAGRDWFVKWHPASPPGMFEAEADGLAALAGASPLRVPTPLAWNDEPGGAFLLMEYVVPGPAQRGLGERMGRALAELHRRDADGSDAPGWPTDNWIGSLPQANSAAPTWSAFWRDRRIVPQLERARRRGHLVDEDSLDRVVDAIPDALADVDSGTLSLLHGDLWSGNAYADPSGRPVVIDPAVYRGHSEVDLAMTELFGGFDAGFYSGYADALPVEPAYRAFRRSLYQLYYLLVHVNLFGAGYEARTRATARTVVAAVG